jgi:hypothetical protein
VPLRAQLKSVKILFEETPVTPENVPGLAERLAELAARIEQQPQFSAVRPASIALRNLIVSLRRAELSVSLPDEREIAARTNKWHFAAPVRDDLRELDSSLECDVIYVLGGREDGSREVDAALVGWS